MKINTSKYDKVIMKVKPRRFVSPLLGFEIFCLINYDKVLYLDSDTLVSTKYIWII